ncbi:MAG TPA: glutamate-5-semialdehyde dehydrogenase [Segeticoccus sp.]|uniref:glutamate-5-semialdehyde dehydrogenase n=1 Tax=Segeticoccus sp. TaxID=2706531 RepID=UPI002D80FB56|nr:glutamate-5-semialdehyde dehydrogenase [Segeticoccus sp.]HET8601680.1 glutamate-5-semialdehyde dehydrogenase [Segeticoccus sp.]
MVQSNSSQVEQDAAGQVTEVATRSREAARVLRPTSGAVRNTALRALADAVDAAATDVVRANGADLSRGREGGLSEALLDRLALDEARVHAVAEGLRDVAALPDPLGDVVRGSTLPNGLQVRQLRVPMGVVGMIYEARPNVTVDAAGLALKSGNAVILRGGSAAEQTNRALVGVLREALTAQGLPADAVALLEGGREVVRALMAARGLVDVLIPRGGAGLIRTVVEESTVPVIETGVGNCHVYVDAAADLGKALPILLNSKTHRPSVCNAAESLLVHRDVADAFLPKALTELTTAGVRVHVDERAARCAQAAGTAYEPATEEDWDTEYLSLDLAVRVVDSLDEALDHVGRHGSGHTEAIVTEDRSAARRWVAEVDAAAVLVNASTRFTDGAQLGLGAEIGISTQKLHARGPMGLAELTTTTWVIEGDGQVRA